MAISQISETAKGVIPPPEGRHSLEEFWALPDPGERYHYELIGGYVHMAPPPKPPHGKVDSRLNVSLVVYLSSRGMPGNVYHPPEPIYTDDTYVEPDMMYVSNELEETMGPHRTSADIVFEYASKGTARYDRTEKAEAYLALAVREMWLLNSSTKTIEIRNARQSDQGRIWDVRMFGRGEWATSIVLDGWRVSVDDLFRDL